jgi:hypothetical protein
VSKPSPSPISRREFAAAIDALAADDELVDLALDASL